jgi:hypothetical protein
MIFQSSCKNNYESILATLFIWVTSSAENPLNLFPSYTWVLLLLPYDRHRDGPTVGLGRLRHGGAGEPQGASTHPLGCLAWAEARRAVPATSLHGPATAAPPARSSGSWRRCRRGLVAAVRTGERDDAAGSGKGGTQQWQWVSSEVGHGGCSGSAMAEREEKREQVRGGSGERLGQLGLS